jgi:hypothetical protein
MPAPPPARQRYLLTTHLDAIAQLTRMEPGQVDIHRFTWSITSPVSPEWQPGYWLVYDYILTGSDYHQHLGWVWSLATTRFPADYRNEQPWTDRREIPAGLAQDLLRLVTQGATP